MRISGGDFKGRKVASRKALHRGSGPDIRPTSAKVREALFDILRPVLSESLFLDLYAGTGTVGIEAVSRGAHSSCLVESDRGRAAAIGEALQRIDAGDRVKVYRDDAAGFLRKAADTGLSFDIIFADPPYASEEIERILPLIACGAVLKTGGLLVLERPSRAAVPSGANEGILRFHKDYRYGDTTLSLFRKDT